MTRMYVSREAAKKTESKRAWDGKPRGIQGSFPRDWQDSRVNVSNPLRGPSPFAAPTAAPIQRKATVSVPTDPLEKAADEGAEKLLRMEEPAFENGASGTIQRKCASCEDEDEKNKIHAKREGGTNDNAAMDTSSAIAAAQRPGLPLPRQTRAFFEPRMGADLSGVRIHTDAEAARAAAGVQAKAYTWHNKIVFGAGEYAPETDSGKRLLAHELMHWRQQAGGAGGVVQREPVELASRHVASEFSEGQLVKTNRHVDLMVERGANRQLIAKLSKHTLLKLVKLRPATKGRVYDAIVMTNPTVEDPMRQGLIEISWVDPESPATAAQHVPAPTPYDATASQPTKTVVPRSLPSPQLESMANAAPQISHRGFIDESEEAHDFRMGEFSIDSFKPSTNKTMVKVSTDTEVTRYHQYV